MRTIVEWRFVAELHDRQIGFDLALVLDDETLRVGRLADDREIETPFDEDRFGLGFLCRIEHHEHALLAFRQHHLISAHAFFAARDFVEIELNAEPALRAHFNGRRSETCSAHVLNGDDAALGHDFETGFEQQLLREGIANLHGRALLFRIGLERSRSHGGAMNAITTRLGAEIDDGTANACRLGVENLIRFGETDRHGIDENIAVITRVKIHRAADRRHAKRISIAANARNNAGHKMARLSMFGRTEAQQVEAGDGARTHGEDIAQNATDTCRRALIGLDERWMIMAFHLEDAGLSIANIDDAGIFTRTLNDPWRFRRQFAQMQARGFIRAMLVPHSRENTELGKSGRAADQLENAIVFIGLEAVFGNELGSDFHGLALQVTTSGCSGCNQALEQARAIDAANERIDQIFWMRHHAEHIHFLRINAGYAIG